jgi:hypothetical protein
MRQRFHEVFVDLYFLRKLVRPGGMSFSTMRNGPLSGPPYATTISISAGKPWESRAV